MDKNSENKLIEELLAMMKNSFTVKYATAVKDISRAQSKFGGKPDVPANFRWPYYAGEIHGDISVNRPLSFLAQINLAEINEQGGELPKAGVLSFFY